MPKVTRNRKQTCSICLQEGAYLSTNGCDGRRRHLFCHQCIAEWMDQRDTENRTCPVCRNPFTDLVTPGHHTMRAVRRERKRTLEHQPVNLAPPLSDFERDLISMVLRHLVHTRGQRTVVVQRI